VQEVLRLFFKEHTPKVLQSDNCGEFTNAKLKELLDNLHIKHITSLPYKPSSNGQVECFNRTIKGMIMQYMVASNSRRYLYVLPKIVDNYNNTYHITIKSTLAVVWAGDHIGQARKNIKANGVGNQGQDKWGKHLGTQDWQLCASKLGPPLRGNWTSREFANTQAVTTVMISTR